MKPLKEPLNSGCTVDLFSVETAKVTKNTQEAFKLPFRKLVFDET